MGVKYYCAVAALAMVVGNPLPPDAARNCRF
jgi:hypothetical protein